MGYFYIGEIRSYFLKSGCECEKNSLIHFLVWSEEILLFF